MPYRVGSNWRTTIVLEGKGPADQNGRRPGDKLVAWTGDNPNLAKRIVDLLNRDEES